MGYINEPGAPLTVAFISDITERKRAEEAIKSSEERYRSLVENSPDCIKEIDVSGRLLSIKKAGPNLLDSGDTEDVVGSEYIAFVADGDRDRVRDCLERASRGETAWTDYRSGAMPRRSYMGTFVPTRDRVVRVMGISADIKARKGAEEALRRSERRLRAIVENLPIAAVYIEGESMALNRTAERVAGYASEELSSIERWFRALYGTDWKIMHGLYEKDRAAGSLKTRVVPIRTRDGRDRLIDFASGIVENGEIWVLRDITEDELALRRRLRLAAIADPGSGVELLRAPYSARWAN